jgi:hypothetical protein
MGVGRLAPHRVWAKYARALAEIPLPVRSFTGIDPSALRILIEAEIAGRRVEFGILAGTPRLWVSFPDHLPPVLGYLTGLDGAVYGAAPELHVTETDHLEWARHTGRAARIKHEALAAWQAAQRECEG